VNRWPVSSLPHVDRRAKIVAKDTVDTVEFLAEIPTDRDLIVVESPPIANAMGRAVRRRRANFEVLRTLARVRAPASLSPSGRWLLATGPLLEGIYASSVLVDVEAFEVVRVLPVSAPFAWVDDARFVAQTPSWVRSILDTTPPTKRLVDPEIAAKAPWLVTDRHGMVLVDLTAETATALLDSNWLDHERVAIVSPARDIMYSTTHFGRVSAVRLVDGKLLWQKAANRSFTEGNYDAMMHDRSRDHLMIAGDGKDDFVALAADGTTVGAMTLCDRLGTFPRRAWTTFASRDDGRFVVANRGGVVVDFGPDEWIAYLGARRGIAAATFVEGGTRLVVGGSERNLRVIDYA
jgi:hypothetical protein